jgi:hypothetical protein
LKASINSAMKDCCSPTIPSMIVSCWAPTNKLFGECSQSRYVYNMKTYHRSTQIDLQLASSSSTEVRLLEELDRSRPCRTR